MSNRAKARRSRSRVNVNNTTSRWKLYTMMSMCTLILVTGFFFAARQHFSSIDYGIKNSRLRRQLDDLETEKRRLMIAREISVSPSEIKRAAKKFGIVGEPAETVEMASAVNPGKPAELATTTATRTSVTKAPQYSVIPAAFSADTAKAVKTEKTTKESGERPRQVVAAALAAR